MFLSAFSMVLTVAQPAPAKLVVAHRGASGYAPEHSQQAYEIALSQRADVLELDLVVSKDQQLLIRHENELSLSTNIAERPEFASRKTSKIVDGLRVFGWFAEDFTLAELRSLRLRETKAKERPHNTRLNDRWPLWSLQDFLNWNELQWQQGRRFAVYMELKHPTYFRYQAENFSADTAELLRRQLQEQPLPPGQTLFLESFEAAPLQRWHAWRAQFKFPIHLVQLLGDVSGGGTLPSDNFAYAWDQVYQVQQQSAGKKFPTYADMVTPAGLRMVASYADAVGPWRDNLYPFAGGPIAPWLQQAKMLGLKIHPYTYRAEDVFRQVTPAGKRQTLCEELTWLFQQTWLDGVFTDQPDIALQARSGQCPSSNSTK